MNRILLMIMLCGILVVAMLVVLSTSPMQAATQLSPSSPTHQSVLRSPSRPQNTPYRITGKPTMTADRINQVLAAYGSPAQGTGDALYRLGVQYGIDPVFALAFFQHESTFGRYGMAAVTFSLGNLRCLPAVPCTQGYAQFASWEQGYAAWYTLIHDLYIEQWELVSIEAIIPVYAPSSDHNDVSAYIHAIEHAVDGWRAGEVQL